MLDIQAFNHVGIRVTNKASSIKFYQLLGFDLINDVGFDQGHPVIMRHPSTVVVNLLGPASVDTNENILMDIDDKYPGYTHIALTVSSLEQAKSFLKANDINITGSFSFNQMSAIFIRDPDRNVIELDAYTEHKMDSEQGYEQHPS